MSNLTILRGWIKELKLTDIAQSFFSGPSQEKLTRLSADQVKRHILKLNNEAWWFKAAFEEASNSTIFTAIDLWSLE